MKTKTTLSQLYNFPEFRARARFKSGVFQDSEARVVALIRSKKKQFARYASSHRKAFTIIGCTGFVI